jgi:hypothetical protein
VPHRRMPDSDRGMRLERVAGRIPTHAPYLPFGARPRRSRTGNLCDLLTRAVKSEAAQGAFDLRYMWSDSVEVLT